MDPKLNRRQMLWSEATRLALGGILGSFLATGCRTPRFVREDPEGVPTGYVIDPAICTHNLDCARVCPCDAVGFTGHSSEDDGPVCRTCWIDLEKCCGCGRCYRRARTTRSSPATARTRSPRASSDAPPSLAEWEPA
jgi:ferredoxin